LAQNRLNQLGKDICATNLPPHLNIPPLQALRLTCRNGNGFFTQSLQREFAKIAAQLFKHIAQAEWDAAERVLAQFPRAMFSKVGNTNALAHAINQGDHYSRELMQRCAEKNNLLQEYTEHKEKQNTPVDVRTLVTHAYEQYLLIDSDPTLSNKEKDQHYINLVGKTIFSFPWLVREMCHVENIGLYYKPTWTDYCDFTLRPPSNECVAFSHKHQCDIEVLNSANTDGLAIAIGRGFRQQGAIVVGLGVTIGRHRTFIEEDLRVILHMLDMRSEAPQPGLN